MNKLMLQFDFTNESELAAVVSFLSTAVNLQEYGNATLDTTMSDFEEFYGFSKSNLESALEHLKSVLFKK